MDLAGIRLTQIPYPLGLGLDDHDILVAVGLVFATVVQSLFCWVLRTLAAAVRAIDDHCYCPAFPACLERKLAGLAFRHYLQRFQGLLQEGPPVMAPVGHAR